MSRGFIAHLGDVLRMRREALGLSQYQLAARIANANASVKRAHVARIEKTSTAIRLDTLGEYADALGCSPSWLLHQAEERARLWAELDASADHGDGACEAAE